MGKDGSPGGAAALAAQLREEIASLDRELAEIELLVGQARVEATRHEQKRAQTTERLAHPDGNATLVELAEGYGTLVVLTRRAVLMDAQVDVLEGKRKALVRHRTALGSIVDQLLGLPEGSFGTAAAAAAPGAHSMQEDGAMPPSLSRVVLSAQEDLRREIARSMHDGPAQSLTNIVLQAQIVELLLDRDPSQTRGELRMLVSMVQQTLEATKNFIFDVRPMVLDDLGLLPTLRRSTRDRGRRAHIPVEFESLGAERRLPMDIESSVFRILDEALAAYLAQAPERVLLRLDWSDELEARLSASRTPTSVGGEPLPEIPTGDVPDTLKRMIQDRHDAQDAAVAAAQQAAIVVLPAAARRDVQERAGAVGARVEILAGGGELHLVVRLPASGEDGPEA